MSDIALLEVKNLKKEYTLDGSSFLSKSSKFAAVNDVSFTIERGKTLGLVGESGCGKSTLGRTVLKLIEPDAGSLLYNGVDITKYSQSQMRNLRKDMQIIFQDPYASLNSKMSVYDILEEPLIIHNIYKSTIDREKRVFQLLDYVKLSKESLNKYPHQFSGGQRQRICIARALATKPSFIVCDESVSALDVSVQAQVVNILMDLQKEFKISYLFITHDLKVVNFISDKIAVMYFGKIVEQGSRDEIFSNPKHPYTKALISAIPNHNINAKKDRIILVGGMPSPQNPPKGCFFSSRCWRATERCLSSYPEVTKTIDGEYACYNPLE